MSYAKRAHLPAQEYEFTEDGRALTTFSSRGGRIDARFALRGVGCLVRTHRYSSGAGPGRPVTAGPHCIRRESRRK
ncbi:hypothetical protein ACFXPV_31695 [Streptomyces sp. NPDC059118]|uniref:hypothetical protein n=1 Tax=unclassified Streptomyces TaxID=2593676 RepID=UPI0036CEC9EB